MIVKYGDRLTLDGALALQFDGGLQKFLDFVRGQNRYPDQLPFSETAGDAVRFMRFNGQIFIPMSEMDARREIPGPLRLATVVADQREPALLEKFLTSKAHHQLAFAPDPLLFGMAGERFLFAVGEGMSGRKYMRNEEEVISFLRTHPEANGLYSDIEMRLMFEREIKTADDLLGFLGGDLARLDYVLDLISLLSGYLFESSAPEIAAKKSWVLELNPVARATLDFRFYDAPAHKFPHTGFAPATERLSQALREIIAFAKRNGVEQDAKGFEAAYNILNGPAQERGEMWKTFTRTREGHSVEEAYRLFRAAVTADQFAGMGSWNDIQIAESEELHRVSNAVALRLLEALCASVDGLSAG